MIIVSWDGHAEINDGVNCTATMHKSWGLPTLEAVTAKRSEVAPVITGVRYADDFMLPPLHITIESQTNADTIRGWLHRWFDGKDGRVRPLVICDRLDPPDFVPEPPLPPTPVPERPRIMRVLPVALIQTDGGAGYQFTALIKPDGADDPHYRWLDISQTTVTWTVTSSGQSQVVANGGEDEAYPVIKLIPRTARSGGHPYKRWIPIKWRNGVGSAQYPVEITNGGLNTAALVTASKMLANGDDVTVEVNGARVNRWLGGMNTSSTKIWIALAFQTIAPVTLASALGAGEITSVEVSGDITDWPSAGIFMIGSEAFTYTSKVNNQGQFVGIGRGAHGTTAASHSAGAQVDLIQHSVYLLYGNLSAPAYTQPTPLLPPVFDLAASTNGSWVYTHFGENSVARMGGWTHSTLQSAYSRPYSTGGAPPKILALSLWDYMGIVSERITNIAIPAAVSLTNVCGIDGVNITAGELYFDNESPEEWWGLRHYGSTVDGPGQLVASTNAPGTRNTVTAWTQNISLTGLGVVQTSYYFNFQVRVDTPTDLYRTNFAGLDAATVTLHSANTPLVALGGENSNYAMTATIRNTTTGEAIVYDFSMALNGELLYDVRTGRASYGKDVSVQAVRRVGAARLFWLRLLPGNNNITFTDPGTGNVDVVVSFFKRYYA